MAVVVVSLFPRFPVHNIILMWIVLIKCLMVSARPAQMLIVLFVFHWSLLRAIIGYIAARRRENHAPAAYLSTCENVPHLTTCN